MSLTRRSSFARTVSIQLSIAVVAGLAWMAFAGAPTRYLAVNAAALAAGLAAIRWLKLPVATVARGWLALAIIAAFALTAIVGVEADGAKRWFALGPLDLHTGYLLLPLAMSLAARLQGWRTSALIALAALSAVAHPDFATSAALALSATVLAWRRKTTTALTGAVAALGLAFLCWNREVWLPPVTFVESVVSDAAAINPPSAIVLWIAQIAAMLAVNWRSEANSAASWLCVGWALVALFLPYPSILIGYGAAPILGLALARAEARSAIRVW